MDPPPLPPLPTTITTTATAAATSMQLNYPDSVDSSPRSRNADTWDEPLAQIPGAKLRLMCSYGGHIIPRPHDKSLCYVGGETRIVVAERHSALSDLCSRLSRTLLNGRPFTLKYQLPNEDLDSLISVTTDDDLDNMIEEYDRTSSTSPLKPSRLRLFLFFAKPETAASMGALLDDAKSESWFVDALNGSGLLPRNLSDSATMDCLLNGSENSLNDLEGISTTNPMIKNVNNINNKNNNVVSHDVHSISQELSPFVESNNTSSFESSTSSPCLSNLPPIRVRMDDNGGRVMQGGGHRAIGIEEQFAQISTGFSGGGAPPMAAHSGGLPPSGENVNRVITSDDERERERSSEQSLPVAFRKPPLPMPLQPLQVKIGGGGGGGGGGYSLPSPDSVASDSSIASANSMSKPMHCQEQQIQVTSRDNMRGPVSPNTSNNDASDQGSRNQVQQVQDSGYMMSPQADQHHHQQQQQLQQQQQQQQQFVHANTHYVHHPPLGQVPMQSYYTMYAPPPSQQQIHHQIDHQQQYPVYLMPVPQSQPYNMPLQSNMAETTAVSASRLTSPNPGSAVYKDSSIPPVYPTKAASPPMSEMSASVYKTAVPQTTSLVSNQYQQQYMGFSQMHHHHPSQSIAVPSSATANYAYEYANPSHEQVFYTQHQPAPLPPQYQSMTPAAAAAAVAQSEDSKQQLPTYSAADQNHTTISH